MYLLDIPYNGTLPWARDVGLETWSWSWSDQDHFFEVLVSEGGLEQDLRLCATATLLVSKVETSK